MKHLSIHKNAKITEGLTKLNSLRNMSRLILFVIDDTGKVIGTVTDGDIRRAIVKEQNLDKSMEEICNRNFFYLSEPEDFIDLSKYHKLDIKNLPVLDKDGKITDILDLTKVKSILPLECVIMAGGRGKRLSPLTDKIPKPMLPLGGKPIIEYNIDRLIRFGIKKIYISLGYLGQQIKDYFGDGSSKGISIEYVWEDSPLGTAGALTLLQNIKTKYILLMNSDLFTNVDFEKLYVNLIQQQADMAVASIEHKIDIPYAVFETKNKEVKSLKEKPSYIYHVNAGIYILKRELIKKIPEKQFFDITDLMEMLISEKLKLIYDPIVGYWIDIGKPVDYEQAQEFVKHIKQ